MSKQRKQLQKKKEREAEAKKRVLARRESIRKKAKMEKMVARMEEKARPKLVPYRKDEDDEYRQKIAEQNLEHNIHMLQALEEEYLEEQKSKASLNEELEAEGYKSLEEKINALHKQAIEAAEAAGQKPEGGTIQDVKDFINQNSETLKNRRKKKGKFSGSAEYRFSPNASDEEDSNSN